MMCSKIHALILFGIVLIFVMACGQSGNSEDTLVNVKGASYAVIKFDRANSWLFKDSKPAALSTDEISEVEDILREAIEDYNREPYPLRAHPEYNLDKSRFIINLSQYKRQLVPVLNAKGEKEVWVNCFCEDDFDGRKEEIVCVEDGGKCFFNVKINLTKKAWYDLRVNGKA